MPDSQLELGASGCAARHIVFAAYFLLGSAAHSCPITRAKTASFCSIGAGQMGSHARWGRADLTGFYFFSTVWVHLVPLKTHDFEGVRPDFNRF